MAMITHRDIPKIGTIPIPHRNGAGIRSSPETPAPSPCTSATGTQAWEVLEKTEGGGVPEGTTPSMQLTGSGHPSQWDFTVLQLF